MPRITVYIAVNRFDCFDIKCRIIVVSPFRFAVLNFMRKLSSALRALSGIIEHPSCFLAACDDDDKIVNILVTTLNFEVLLAGDPTSDAS